MQSACKDTSKLRECVRYEGYWRIRGLPEGSETVIKYSRDCLR
jgi:hypothetical protein